jgi:hypothetical protein
MGIKTVSLVVFHEKQMGRYCHDARDLRKTKIGWMGRSSGIHRTWICKGIGQWGSKKVHGFVIISVPHNACLMNMRNKRPIYKITTYSLIALRRERKASNIFECQDEICLHSINLGCIYFPSYLTRSYNVITCKTI